MSTPAAGLRPARSPLGWLPLALTGLRAALAPLLLWLAWGPAGQGAAAGPGLRAALGACLAAAFLSDLFDGILARRLGVATPGLRRLDSAADSLFYVAATAAAWHLHPAALRDRALPLGALAALELARYAVDLYKFGREASYHMWSSKIWGITLFVAFFALLVLGIAGWPVAVAIYVGIIADAEGLAISVILGRWRTDVPTFVHALRLQHREVHS